MIYSKSMCHQKVEWLPRGIIETNGHSANSSWKIIIAIIIRKPPAVCSQTKQFNVKTPNELICAQKKKNRFIFLWQFRQKTKWHEKLAVINALRKGQKFKVVKLIVSLILKQNSQWSDDGNRLPAPIIWMPFNFVRRQFDANGIFRDSNESFDVLRKAKSLLMAF